jgi:PAS domain S-box-containing protein
MKKLDNSRIGAENLLSSLNDGLYATDTDRRIIYWSPSAERITGWQAEDILGKRCADDVLAHVDKDGHPLCGEEHCPLHRAMVTDQGSDISVIVFALTKSGKRKPMRVSVAPIRNASGEVIGGVETFRDVSAEFHDLHLARQIQDALLRKETPKDSRVKFSSYYLPWGMIGGDYYAINKIDDDRFAFMLADITGHGLAAALGTIYLDSLWQSHLDLLAQPGKLATVVSRKLSPLIGQPTDDAMRFATAIFGLLDLNTMSLVLSYAGGPAPFLFHADGKLESLKGSGLPLGLPFDAEYEEHTVPIRPGDCLLAFTDGVTEVRVASGELLGAEGLEQILKESDYPASKGFKEIEETLLKSSDRIRFSDDLTFLEVRVT